ncbi:MAG TPA: flagellar hook-associated protein FlgK, partial [bacterium]|nr:flagellar hook-associated protein FlgK [bacterium]
MINSFQSINTITSGLILQQLEQEVNASNIANPSVDSNGYLMNSLEQVNVGMGAPLTFGSGNGLLQVGTGPFGSSITRLRSSFLDSQIQQESSIVGQNEVLTNMLTQINGIVNGPSTLQGALNTFSQAWSALAPNPLNTALRAAVVNAGVNFAQLSNNQYSQLQNLQTGMNGQVNQTVTQINNLLQQLASINRQLLSTAGSNQNPLLDARDYALDRLARLINIQTNFGTNGTVSVYLSGSSLSLVDGAGASILQTNVMNGHNPGLVGVALQSSEGTMFGDVSRSVTGGDLGGELYARDVVLESYTMQLNQIATSVMNVTNVFNESGYAADGTTTGTAFFTGTGAADINVNASILTDSTHALVATALGPANTADGTIANFLGNIQNLLANNFIESNPKIYKIAGGIVINPSLSIGSQAANFKTTPTAGGSFTVDGNIVNWTPGETITQILQAINAADPNVYAVFNATDQRFYMFSNAPVTITDVTGNFTLWGTINNVLTSTIRMNNSFAPSEPSIVYGFPNSANAGLNSTSNPSIPLPNGTGNLQAFQVTPGLGGSFVLDGVTINWSNNGQSQVGIGNQSLYQIVQSINAAAYPGTVVTALFGTALNQAQGQTFNPTNPQTLTIFSANNPLPITIIDKTGNFTTFTGLDGNTPIGNLASGILNNVSTQLASQTSLQNQAVNSLTQLNNAQANIAGVATTSGQAGVPVAVIEQQAMQSLISYNAMLEVLQV